MAIIVFHCQVLDCFMEAWGTCFTVCSNLNAPSAPHIHTRDWLTIVKHFSRIIKCTVRAHLWNQESCSHGLDSFQRCIQVHVILLISRLSRLIVFSFLVMFECWMFGSRPRMWILYGTNCARLVFGSNFFTHDYSIWDCEWEYHSHKKRGWRLMVAATT